MLFHAGGESAGGIKVVRGAAAMAGVVVKAGESARPETHVPAVSVCRASDGKGHRHLGTFPGMAEQA
jgi:hypothetical protein